MQPLECCSPLVLSYPKSFLSAAEPPLGRAEEGRRCLALRRFLPEGGRDEGWWFVVFSLQREKPTQRVFGSREKSESFCWNRFETLLDWKRRGKRREKAKKAKAENARRPC